MSGAVEGRKMSGVFREGHNRPRPRLREPLRLGPPPSPWKKRAALGLPLLFAALVVLMLVTRESVVDQADAATHEAELDRPIAAAS